MRLEVSYFLRIVSHQLDRSDMERSEHVGISVIVALVRLEPENLISLEGVVPVILQLIRPNLANESNTTPFLSHVQHDSSRHCPNLLEGLLQLLATIAAQRA